MLGENPENPRSRDPWKALEDLKSRRTYAERGMLFHEGERCTGVYLVEKGNVRLLVPVRHKQHKVLEVARPGAALGLSEAMSGMPHKLTAEAAEVVQVAFIERMALMKFLRKHHEVCLQLVCLLSEDLHELYQRFRMLLPAEPKSHKKVVARRVQ